MNMKARLKSPSAAPLFAFLLSLGLLCGAWVFQYGLGYPPCVMCYWQRHVHKAVIVLAGAALLAGMAAPKARKPLLVLTILALLGSAGLGFFHMGVEFGWWEGPKACAAGPVGDFTFNPDDPFGGLDKPIAPPSCDKALWHFLGLSMAAWNAVISLFGAAVTAKFGFYGGQDA